MDQKKAIYNNTEPLSASLSLSLFFLSPSLSYPYICARACTHTHTHNYFCNQFCLVVLLYWKDIKRLKPGIPPTYTSPSHHIIFMIGFKFSVHLLCLSWPELIMRGINYFLLSWLYFIENFLIHHIVSIEHTCYQHCKVYIRETTVMNLQRNISTFFKHTKESYLFWYQLGLNYPWFYNENCSF